MAITIDTHAAIQNLEAAGAETPTAGSRRRSTSGRTTAAPTWSRRWSGSLGIHGMPKTIRLDNGPEFISKTLDLWAWLNGVTLDFSRPGKPTDNAFIESFKGSFRAECLNACRFLSLADARAKCAAWLSDYNTVRAHSSIGQKTPIELAKISGPACRP